MANPTAQPPPSRRRFAPIPIETTFTQFRKTGAEGELTPSPSPKSPSPPPREKRRFAPQLVESSVRRSKRAGDEGPATRPTDKTDITPYTKHIYAPKAKKRHGAGATTTTTASASATPSEEVGAGVIAGTTGQPRTPTGTSITTPWRRRIGHARRESCDDEIASSVFDQVAREAQIKLQELAMSAFPNSSLRVGGAEHFYVREGSDDDSIPSRGRTAIRGPNKPRLSRRNSSVEDISWAFKEMQDHAKEMEDHAKEMQARRTTMNRTLDRVSTWELDNMSIDSPPSDAMGLTTRAARQSSTASPLWSATRSGSGLAHIGESNMPYLRPESPRLAMIREGSNRLPPKLLPPSAESSPPARAIGESYMPYIPSASLPYVPASQVPQETGFRNQGTPFKRFAQPERDMSLERARNLHRLRANHSPPMLGKDLVFRMCPSPKQTKLEPDHLWDLENETTLQEPNRDVTGQHGLWRGYCYTADAGSEQLAPVERPAMLITPYPPATPRDPSHPHAFSTAPVVLSEEPTPLDAQSRAGTLNDRVGLGTLNHMGSVSAIMHPRSHQQHHGEPKGLHMLQGLEERLLKQKAQADLEEKIAGEFDDAFVTQVYNYLSLGYPAMARQYDAELSKISRISVSQMQREDDEMMEQLWASIDAKDGNVAKKTRQAMGHIVALNREEKLTGVPEEDRCPRWRALKLYIFEWARQHPDLDAISPLAWGVRERRGSWGI